MKKHIQSLVFLLIISFNYSSASNYYWVGGAGNWNSLSHWATTSGGSTFYTAIPTVNDNVIFDSLSFSGAGQTVTVNITSAACDNMDWSKALFNPSFSGTGSDTIKVYGSLTFNAVMNNNFLGDFYFLSPSTDSIQTNGISLKRNIYFNGVGTYKLKTAITCLNNLNFLRGTLKTNGFNITCKNFNAASSNTRALNLGASTITVNGSGAAWDAGSSGLTLTAGTSKIIFTNATTANVTFNSGAPSIAYNLVSFQCPNVQLLSAGNFDSLLVSPGVTMVLPQLKLQVLNMLVANGTCGSPIIIKSSGSSAATISKSSAANITCNYLRLSLITKSGVGTLTANNSIIELAPCTGWVVNAIASATTYYWINGNGKWSDPLHWSATSGGASASCIPGPGDNVIFNTASGFTINDSVLIDHNAYCNNMTWTGILSNPCLAGSGTRLEIKGSLSFVASMTAAFTGDYKFTGTAVQTVNTAGVQLNGDAYFNGTGGQWQLTSALSSVKNLNIQSGHLNTQNNNITCKNFISSSGTGRQLTLGSSVVTLTGFGDAWNIVAPFTLSAGTSEIICNTATPNVVNFKGAALIYNNLTLSNFYTSITSSNTFKKLAAVAGSTLTLQGGATQTIDSIVWQGTCSKPITIESSLIYGSPAVISKTGYATTNVNYVYLKNITAAVTAPVRVYNATNSVGQYTTTGWTVTNTLTGGKKYWIGGTGNWSDNSHWSLTSGGAATTCIPAQADTVIFDANSFSATGQVVNVDVDGYCKVMDWTGAAFNPKLFLIRNLIVKRKATLTAVMLVARYSRSVQLQFLPSGNNVDFDSKKVLLNTDVLFEGSNLTDSLKLQNHMYLSDTTSFSMIRGTFITNNDSINAGAMTFINIFPKTTRLGSSFIDLTFGWKVITNGTMTLNAGTSTININGHTTGDYFHGDSLIYNNVIIASPSDTNTIISGSNTFNNLTIMPGVEAKVTAATTQTILNSFIANGNCIDSIKIESSVSGTPIIITKASGTVTTRCMRLKDINRTGGATFNTLFSTNLGNVTGWTFTATPPVTANFTTANSICIGTTSVFTNTSSSYLSGAMTYSWNFGDGTSSTAANPSHTYLTGGKKYVTLTATYTSGNCSSTHRDSVLVNKPFVNLSCAEGDSTICAGQQIGFNATGEPGSLYQFLINGTPVAPYSIDSLLSTTVTNGQIVTASVNLNGCFATSTQSYPITVDPLPTITLSSSDADDNICTGSGVTFTAGGGHTYSFFIDTVSQGFGVTNNVFTTSSLINGQVVSVVGTDTITGCSATGAPVHTMVVNAFPTPTMTCSSGNLICAGTSVTFTAAGAGLFEFFINGVSQGAPGATTTFTTTALTNGAVVTVKGTTNSCTATSVNSFTFTVNPIPVISVTNNATANTICAGQPITFTASGASLYQFFVNGISQGAASGSNTFTTSALTNGQTISVNGSSNGCLGTSSGTSIIVNPLPTVTLSSSDADNTICLNQSVTFTAGGASTYEFFVNGSSQGAPTVTSTFTTAGLTNGQTVSVKGYTAAGCGANGNTSYTFNVLPLPTVNFYSSESDNTICAGEPITFTALGTNTYEFFMNGISQGVPSTTNTFLASSLPVGSPVVSVVGTSSNGCPAQSATAFTITVNPIPNISLTSSDADNIICNGSPVTFTAGGASTYQFFINGVSQGAVSSVATFTSSSLTNGQTISVSGALNGCQNTGATSYTMVVNPSPTINLSSSDVDNIICEGQSVTYTASGAGTYEFFINGASQGAASATATFSTNTLANNDVVTVQGTAAGCSANGTSAFTMNVNALPVISLASSDADNIICTGETVNFTAGGANLYQFFINGISQGAATPSVTFSTNSLTNGQTISVTGTTNYGCAQTSLNIYSFSVNALPVITLSSSDADNQICTNESVTFTASGATMYEFFINGISQGAAGTTNSFTSNTISNLQTVTVQGSSNGCSAYGNNSFTYSVHTYPAVNLAASEPSGTICAGQPVTFTANGANMYQFFIDGISQGAPSASGLFTSTSIANGQTVTVNGINVVCPSAASQSFVYTVLNYPVTAVVSSDADNTICYGSNVTFTASGASTYEFFVSGISQGASSIANTFNTTLLENNDVVTVMGSNGNCSLLSTNTFTFHVNKMNLNIISTPSNLICQGSSISFNASGANQYQFFVNGIAQGPLSSNNSFSSSSLNNGDVVSFTGMNTSTGCSQAANLDQFVNVMATPTITAMGSTTFCQGDSVILESNSAIGNQWLLNGTPIANATDSTYVVHASGNYSVQVSQGGNGTIWGIGANINGQLGDSTLVNSFSPKIVNNINNMTGIDAGNEFNIAMNASGNVFVWGDNAYGNLGDGTFTDRNYPYQLPGVSNVTAVAAGANHSLVVSSGSVFAFGNNTDGELGIGNNGIANFPTAVPGLTNITAVSGGEHHSLALKNDGSVWAWGDNQFGQLGDGTYTDHNAPVQVIGLTNVIAISAGSNHSMALKADSTIWVWGNNAQGQLGTSSVAFNDTATRVNLLGKYILVSAGADYSLALNAAGKVYSWGNNQFGQLGDGTTIAHSTPLPINNLNGVKKIKAGVYHSMALKQDQSVWCWGYNAYGQIGNAASTNALVPVHINSFAGAGDLAPGLNHSSVVMSNTATCASTVITSNIISAAPVVIYDHVTFLSTDPGVSYQWYYNNNPILGGINQTQNLIGPGSYFVQVTYSNGCTVTSSQFEYLVGINDLENKADIHIYPNPATNEISIAYTASIAVHELYLTDIVGKKIKIIAADISSNKFTFTVNLSELNNGVYILNGTGVNEIIFSRRVIVSR